MAQQVNDNFQLLAGLPLDDRISKTTIAERDAIPSTRRYEGLMCYVEQTETIYLLQGGITNSDWIGFAGTNGGNGLEVLIDGFFVQVAGKTDLQEFEINDKFRGWDGNNHYNGTIIAIPVILPDDLLDTSKVLLDSQNITPKTIVSAEYTGTGLIFDVIADSFPVDGIYYSATADTVTLSTADATLDRIDLIVANINGTVDKITGTPASTALVVPPDYDPSIYFVIKQVTVKAGETTPDGVVNTLVYDDGIEWDFDLTANITETTNDPYTGTKSLEAVDNTDIDSVKFTSPSQISTADLDLLTFYLKLKETVISKFLYVVFYLDGILIKKVSFSAASGLFDDTNLSYQKISLDKAFMNLPLTNFNEIVIRPFWDSTGYFIDDVRIFKGSGSEPLPDVGIEEAPIDGKEYARKNAAWSEIVATVGSNSEVFKIQETKLNTFGDSISTGMSATAGKDYLSLFIALLNFTRTQYAVSGRGTWLAAKEHLQNVAIGHKAIATVMAGFNDVRRGANGIKTMAKIENCHKSIIVNQFLTSFVPASSATQVNFNTLYNAFSVGGKTSTGRYSTTNGGYLEYTFREDNVVFGTMASDGVGTVYGGFDVSIDGVSQGSFNFNGGSDGISDSSNNNQICPAVLVFENLGYGQHTIRITSTSTNFCVADYFGHLKNPNQCNAIIIVEAIKNNALGYAVVPDLANDAIIDELNALLADIVANFLTNKYPVVLAKSSDYFNVATGLAVDNVHPNDEGHGQIFQGVYKALEKFLILNEVTPTSASFGTRITASVTGTYVLNHSLGTDWKLTLTGNTTFSDSNLPTGTNTTEFTIKMTGAFVPTFPAYWQKYDGTYNGAKDNLITVLVHNGTTSSEEVSYFIATKP